MSKGLLLRDLPGERWLPVVGFEGLYEVSNLGRVWSVARVCKQGRSRGDRLMGTFLNIGYPAVALRKSGVKHRPRHIHTLILNAFVGPCPPGEECCHQDDVRTHCVLTNLSWGTRKHNGEDRVKNGRSARGRRNGNTGVLTDTLVKEIKSIGTSLPGVELARRFGVNKATIYDILKNRSWRHV